MKRKFNFSLSAIKAPRPEDFRYYGSPDSPNFSPPPLIDRPQIPTKVEVELRKACTLVVSGIKPPEERRDASSGKKSEPKEHGRHNKKVLPSSRGPSKATEKTAQVGSMARRREDSEEKYDSGVVLEVVEHAQSKAPTDIPPLPSQSVLTQEEVLREIKANLAIRPKTSAAACVDYSVEKSYSTSRSHTTYGMPEGSHSTSLTSAAETPGDGIKENPLSREVSAEPGMEERYVEIPTRTRSWEHQKRAPRSGSTTRPRSRAGSIAGSIADSIKNYYRPQLDQTGDPARSGRSSRSASLARHDSWWNGQAIRGKLSSISLGSRNRSRSQDPQRSEYDDEYIISPEQLDLNRALPPLPGLDQYHERPKHIVDLMMVNEALVSKLTKDCEVVVNVKNIEQPRSSAEDKQRQLDLARAVMEKMSTGSFTSGPSGPTSPTNLIVRDRSIDLLEFSPTRSRSRPQTSGSGGGVGAVALKDVGNIPAVREEAEPVDTFEIEKNPNWFKRLSRLGWKKSAKISIPETPGRIVHVV